MLEMETVSGIPASAAVLPSELADSTRLYQTFIPLSEDRVEICQSSNALWVVVKRPGVGGFALRAALSPDAPLTIKAQAETNTGYKVTLVSALGEFVVDLQLPNREQSLLRCTTQLLPTVPLLLPVMPRDLYPLDEQGNPAGTDGIIHAAQRSCNAPIIFITLAEPRFGSLLYFQNLTALNPYFLQTETKPDGIIGGQWPALGNQLPVSKEKPLPAGEHIVISDTFVHWDNLQPQSNMDAARQFLHLMGGIYPYLDRPKIPYHDWLGKAEDTLHDLQHSPKATIQHYRHTYIHPYTDTEYPDSMVQMTVTIPIQEYAAWKQEPIPFADELWAGFPRFFDEELQAVRRYLPNVGKDKNADEVDSWYLYHPLANLARMAHKGNEQAKTMLLASLEYGIKVARHFKYHWPIQYNVKTLEVYKDRRKEGEPGQSDVGGLYAFVMLQAWKLTENKRYLEEAKKAIQAIYGMGFETLYQTNLSAWGIHACLLLWKLTGENEYREQAEVFVANFFHNTIFWDSEFGTAKDYHTFLAASCLHDSHYMAIYECFESYCAFHDILQLGQDNLSPEVQMLLTEYCKYTLDRAWYYYPKELPKEALATEIRNGHIDRELAFPLEDLYPDGQPAGQVGQEIYGCGAAFAFVTRAYRRFEDAPFVLYCEYPMYEPNKQDKGKYSLQVYGVDSFKCQARLIPLVGKSLPAVNLRIEDGSQKVLHGKPTQEGHLEFILPANMPLILHWNASEGNTIS